VTLKAKGERILDLFDFIAPVVVLNLFLSIWILKLV
jgi:hypothetical protein